MLCLNSTVCMLCVYVCVALYVRRCMYVVLRVNGVFVCGCTLSFYGLPCMILYVMYVCVEVMACVYVCIFL